MLFRSPYQAKEHKHVQLQYLVFHLILHREFLNQDWTYLLHKRQAWIKQSDNQHLHDFCVQRLIRHQYSEQVSFDGTLNRIGAYVIGSRAAQKCMLRALLEPIATLREYELTDRKFQRLALLEECKNLPWNAVYDMFCLMNNVPVGESFIPEIEKYEQAVTSHR